MLKIKLLCIAILLEVVTVSGLQQNYPELRSHVEKYKNNSDTPDIIPFIAFALFVGLIIDTFIKRFKLPLSPNAFELIAGMIFGLLPVYYKQPREYIGILDIDPRFVLQVLIPVYIFQAVTVLDTHTFFRCWAQILIISLPCYILQVATVGLFMKIIVGRNWLYSEGLLFGGLVGSNDANVIINMLKDSGWNTRHVCTLMEAEYITSSSLSYFIVEAILLWQRGFQLGSGIIFVFPVIHVTLGTVLGYLLGKFMCILIAGTFKDIPNGILITISFPMLIYYVLTTPVKIMAVSFIFVIGIMICKDSSRLCQVTDHYIVMFFGYFTWLMDMVVYFTAGVYLSYHVIDNVDTKDLTLMLMTYVLLQFGRMVAFLIFSFFLSRLGYGITFGNTLILIWSGLKGAANIYLTILVAKENGIAQEYESILLYIFGTVALTHFINVPIMKILFYILGISEKNFNANVNNCMRYLLSLKDHKVRLLKMDSLYCGANWEVVKKETALKHPYINQLLTGEDEDEYFGEVSTICPECSNEVPEQPTAEQLAEMRRDARTKILKVKKVSYSRQYDRGLISKDVALVLLRAVEMAADEKDKSIKLDALHALFRRRGITGFIGEKLMEIMKDKELRPPPTYWRRICYHMVNRPSFTVTINLFIAISAITSIISISCFKMFVEDGELYPLFVMLLISHFLLFYIFLFELIVKILAASLLSKCYGITVYFGNPINIFDFFLLVVNLMVVILYVAVYRRYLHPTEQNTIISTVLNGILALRIFRLLRIFKFYLSEKMETLCNSLLESQIAFAYAIGKGYVTGEEDVLQIIEYLIDCKEVREDMRQKLEDDKLAITKELAIVQRDRPWIAISVKTMQTMMTILSSMNDAIEELKTLGWTNELEYNHLSESLGNRYNDVKSTRNVKLTAPKIIFKEVPWIYKEPKIGEYLYDNLRRVEFHPGSIVCEEGEIVSGVYLIITGILKMVYDPNDQCLERLKELGALPILDLIPSANFHRKIVEYIVSGNTVGELSVLTQRPYNCTVTAETFTQTYFLSSSIMKVALRIGYDPLNGLESKIWKHLTTKLCTSILMNVPTYKSLTQTQIKGLIEKSFIPELASYKTFVVNETIASVILIDGVVRDEYSNRLFKAPCHIPRTVKKLDINIGNYFGHKQIAVKLLIIPTKDMKNYGLYVTDHQSSIIDNDSQRCLLHSIRGSDDHSLKTKGLIDRRVTLIHSPSYEMPTAHLSDDSETDLKTVKVDHEHSYLDEIMIQRRLSVIPRHSSGFNDYADKFSPETSPPPYADESDDDISKGGKRKV